jgi:glycosyltransferase involved in cell wall biosynthesis
MRIVMLSWEYPPRIVGGISPHVSQLSRALTALGYEVHVITRATPNAPDEETDSGGVHVHRVHLLAEPNDFIHEIQLLNDATDRRARRLLEEWREKGEPTIFHAHDWLSLDAARDLKYDYKLPMLGTVHATEKGRHGGIHTGLQRYIHEQEYWLTYESWRIIVCSDFMRQEVHSAFDAPYNKIDVIYNGVDPAPFQFEWTSEERAATRAKYAQPDEPLILFVGRFVREKGIQVLVNAAHPILAKVPNARFVVVGGGKPDVYRRYLEWAHLDDRFVFPGFLSGRELQELYRCADVAVFPSLYEPFGIVALEAMSAGVPVVASEAGGLREVVRHDWTGTSCYVDDPGSLGWAVRRVLDEPERAQRLVRNAHERLYVDFDWMAIAHQTADVYERVWREFLTSYWAELTAWPVSPGAEMRAAERGLPAKAIDGVTVDHPVPAPDLGEVTEKVDEEDVVWSPAF